MMDAGVRAAVATLCLEARERVAAIAQGKIEIGMTADEVTQAWHKPDHFNVTITKTGRDEQWIYPGDDYLYFENGLLTAIQQNNRSRP